MKQAVALSQLPGIMSDKLMLGVIYLAPLQSSRKYCYRINSFKASSVVREVEG